MATYVTSFVCTESTIPNRWARMLRSQLCDDCHREPAVCLVARPQSASLKAIYQPRCPHSSTFSRITETIPNTQGFLSRRVSLICDAFRKRVASPRCGEESALFH